jgi:undecaprenyl-diphosphatase
MPMLDAASSRLLLAFALACAAAAAAIGYGGADVPVFLALNDAAARWLPAPVPSSLTLLGHGLAAMMILSPCLLRAPRIVAAGVLAVPAATLFTRVPKALVAAPRPGAVLDAAGFHVQGMLLSSHNSFPSGHAITAFVVVAVLVLGLDSLRRSVAAAAAVIAAGAAVAASRVMVGAHWPTDVLAGSALGCVAGATGVWASARWPFWRRDGGRLALEAMVACCAVAFALADTGYPLARPLQFLLAAAGLVFAVASFRARRAARTRDAGGAG